MAGLIRRDCLQLGAVSALGLGLVDWLRLSAQGSYQPRGRAKSCILIWLDGGPSHLETFDVKPDAPQEVRGPFRSIKTNVAASPSVSICR